MCHVSEYYIRQIFIQATKRYDFDTLKHYLDILIFPKMSKLSNSYAFSQFFLLIGNFENAGELKDTKIKHLLFSII